MGKRGRKPKSMEREDYVKGVLKQLNLKRNDIISAKNHWLFFVDQTCDCMMGELANILDEKIDSVRLSGIENASKGSNDLQCGELSAKFVIPSAFKAAPKGNKDNSAVKTFGNEYRTPATKPIPQYCITPKVNPFSPISMLRHPQQGEFAVSVAGSPLQVTCIGSETASMSIPLKNGKVMSVLPKPGLNTEAIHGNVDPSVKQQLEALRQALSQILDV